MLTDTSLRYLIPGILLSICVMATFQSCNSGKRGDFRARLASESKKIQFGDTLKVVVTKLDKGDEALLQYRREGKEIEPDMVAWDSENRLHLGFAMESPPLGAQEISITYGSESENTDQKLEFLLLSDRAPALYGIRVLNAYPHDRTAFTQGLEFDGDTLLESTGQYGESTLRKVDFRTGKVLKKIDLPGDVFGEGITIWNDRVYMLTWKSNKGFVFDKNDLSQKAVFAYGASRQGWGLCHSEKEVYKSDGSRYLWILDPETLREKGKLELVTNTASFRKANELEYHEGKIYANVFGKFGIMIIDANTGAIEGVIDLSDLDPLIEKGASWDDVNNVLNGIAIHPERKSLFVTGKRWDKLFEIELVPQS